MVSPPGVWPPSLAYKLQCPCKPGVGNDDAPAVAWGRAAGVQSCSVPSGGAVARVRRGSLGWWGRQGKFSSHWLVSHRHPGISPCDAGLLVAGPHCWAWAERKEELEKQWSTGSRTVEGRGRGNGRQGGPSPA